MQEYGSAHGEEPEDEYQGFDLERYKSLWKEYVDGYGTPRVQHFRDEEYYDGDVKGTGWGHWSDTELEKLCERAQPPIIRNLIKRKVNSICGVEQRGRSEPRALPRNPQDMKSAEVATDSLRYVKERERLNYKKADALFDALRIGYAAVEIGGAQNRVPISNIEWKDFFFDPRSRKPDFSDARYLGIAKWVDADTAKATYARRPNPPQISPQPIPIGDPNAMEAWQAEAMQAQQAYEAEMAEYNRICEVIDGTVNNSSLPDEGIGYTDLPNEMFGDRRRKRVFLVDMWHRDPQKGWFRCVFTGSGKLFTEEAYLLEYNDDGEKRPTHPIIAFSLYVSSELWRYGEIRDMRPVQDELNKRLSKALHRMTVARLIYDIGSFPDGDVEAARKEVARPDGAIPKIPGKEVQIIEGAPLAAADMQMAQDARDFLEMHAGANEQLAGEKGGATSGRMFLAMQQAGMGALSTPFNRWHDFEDRVYRAIWCRIQQFWTAPMYVRVTDDKNAARFAAVNGAPVVQQGNGMVGHNGPYADDPRMRMAWDAAMRPPLPMQGGPPGQPPGMQGPAPGMHQMPDGSMMQNAMMYGGGRGGSMAEASPMQGGPMGRGMLDPNGQAPQPMQGPPPQQEPEAGPMLAELDMDIIVDRAPESAVLQAEQFEQVMQLISAKAISLPPDAIIKLSTLPNKSEVLDALEAAGAKPNPAQDIAAQGAMAEVELKKAQAKKTQADAMTSIGNMQINKKKVSLDERKLALEERRALMEQQRAETELDISEADASWQRAESILSGMREDRRDDQAAQQSEREAAQREREMRMRGQNSRPQ